MRIAWATDIHLNFLIPSQLDAFCAETVATGAEALVVSGDISEAPELGTHLRSLMTRIGRPLYFVLGNHDFYHGSIAGAARAHADRTITVLCGHTHGQGSVRMLPNLVVETGGAEYGAPRIQSIIDVA